ncbi:hypothetical protein Tco_1259222 [Tanacetum coccineum]
MRTGDGRVPGNGGKGGRGGRKGRTIRNIGHGGERMEDGGGGRGAGGRRMGGGRWAGGERGTGRRKRAVPGDRRRDKDGREERGYEKIKTPIKQTKKKLDGIRWKEGQMGGGWEKGNGGGGKEGEQRNGQVGREGQKE